MSSSETHSIPVIPCSIALTGTISDLSLEQQVSPLVKADITTVHSSTPVEEWQLPLVASVIITDIQLRRHDGGFADEGSISSEGDTVPFKEETPPPAEDAKLSSKGRKNHMKEMKLPAMPSMGDLFSLSSTSAAEESQSAPASGTNSETDRYNQIAAYLRPLKTSNEFKRHFIKDRIIGNGAEGYCTHWIATGKGTNGGVIVKSVKSDPWDLPHEVKILDRLKKVRHKHIVEYFGFLDDAEPDRDWILLGYCDYSDAYNCKQRFNARKSKFPEVIVWRIVTQLNAALAFLHEGYGTKWYKNGWAPILHRDVKDSNVLLSSIPGSGLPHARLADFGCSKVVRRKNFDYTALVYGCVFFHPPERPIADQAGDMWASGCVIHTLCVCEAPLDFKCEDTEEKIEDDAWVLTLPHSIIPINILPQHRRKQSIEGYAVAPWAGTYADLLNYWMHRLLDFDPKNRLTAVEAVETMGKDVDGYMETAGIDGLDELIGDIVPPALPKEYVQSTSPRESALPSPELRQRWARL